MTLILLIVVVYSGLYVILSIPKVQDKVKERVCREVSPLLGGKLEIDNLIFYPFSEVVLSGVRLYSPKGELCASIDRVAAGIDLWSLGMERKIVLNYAEIIRLDAKIEQKSRDGEFNIQFLIDALSPKDKKKPSAVFDLRMRNVIVRDSKARLVRIWMLEEGSNNPMANVLLDNLRVDLSIPAMRNDLFRFDIRKIQFDLAPGLSVRDLSANVIYKKSSVLSVLDSITVNDFNIAFPKSSLSVSDISFALSSESPIHAIMTGNIVPSDFSGLLPQLSSFNSFWTLDLDAYKENNNISIKHLSLSNEETRSFVKLNADAMSINSKDSLYVDLHDFKTEISTILTNQVANSFPTIGRHITKIIPSIGNISADISGNMSGIGRLKVDGSVITESGYVDFEGNMEALKSGKPHIKAYIKGEDLEIGNLLSVSNLGEMSFELNADIEGLDKRAEGEFSFKSDHLRVGSSLLSDVDLTFIRKKDLMSLRLDCQGDRLKIDVDADCKLNGVSTVFDAKMDINGFNPFALGIKGKMADCTIGGRLFAHTVGNNIDNLFGNLRVSQFNVQRKGMSGLFLSDLILNIDTLASVSSSKERSMRTLMLRSDWVDADLKGNVHPSVIGEEISGILSVVFPALIEKRNPLDCPNAKLNDFEFKVKIKGVDSPYEFFNTPIRPLSDIPISGSINSEKGILDLHFDTPYLQQGKNKLLRDIGLHINVDSSVGIADLKAGGVLPAKKGDVQIYVDMNALNDMIKASIMLNPKLKSSVKGGLLLDASFAKLPSAMHSKGELSAHVDILPSTISVNDTVWSVANGRIDYSGKRVSVDNFLIRHDEQYIKISGTASESNKDEIKVKLNDIDLDYIFGILNINYVSFGGMATGEVSGRRLMSKSPEAHTDFLRVKNLSYNGAVLGDGELASDYDAQEKKVGIYAVIREPLTRHRRASVNGGIWVTRDSLSFNFDAEKVNLQFMKPFVSAFCSDLRGTGSGKCKLYGSFSDIDLTGNLKADTISMKLDFTNTWYHAGNDSVFMHKGTIDIPPLTLYDDYGHSAELSGSLYHTYFHDPVFNFKLRDARSLLCYDTNEKLNPLWYGTIFGSGSAQIVGRPGLIEIDMNMTTDDDSKFFYVISDTEDLDEYPFLRFTDKRKEILESEKADTVPGYLTRFKKLNNEIADGSSNVILSIKGTVTEGALVTLVMDPKAGDNITATGNGALQMDYNMASNDLRMIGTYILDEGNYNFTLQDIIIKNFSIKKGSQIKFDGDPMNANLDITATYRVNTNLTDLDKSFSTDRELNRTNVPVDAILQVNGPMTHPDITFDIELPTLTSDVERKVKSIVSTNDMMSRQIIYLLALNRFYTPEYTGGSSNGSEWSSMASSTISSQLSNMLSQLTDKVNVAPSFRSDKGDFTDMEFDLALSSRLLNNRLLINGNFGYRDKNTSNTQFVGDFDIEYLLSSNGNLRLKAYNHFNDQNYYLRSALTTQGVGVVFRKDFDRLFRRKRHERVTIDSDIEKNEDSFLDRDSIKK